MKLTRNLTILLAAAGLFALALPAEAQGRGNRHGGGNGNRGNFHPGAGHFHPGPGRFHHGGNRFHHGGNRFHHGGSRVNFYFGGFYPGFYGYPYYASPYYRYPYGYGYPVGAYYSYDPRGIYEGRVANPARSTHDGGGKEVSMAARVQQQLATAGYYRGEIDGIVGQGTRQAIRNYKRVNGLAVDSQIDDELLNAMDLG